MIATSSPRPIEFQPSPSAMAGCDDSPAWAAHVRIQFQPSPGAMAGCDGRAPKRRAQRPCFNPHPARWPGATLSMDATDQPRATGFNPHPARWPGATRPERVPGTPPGGFNPHPARWPGATADRRSRAASRCGFNPHPARWPGATAAHHPAPRRLGRVSTLTRRDGRVRPGAARVNAGLQVASTLTRRDGRVRPGAPFTFTPDVYLFQPSPGAMAGCDYSVTLFVR